MIAIGDAALVSTRAHAAERVIGWISPESRETIVPFFKAFQAGLLANTPAGDTVRVIERHVTGGPEAMPRAVAELQNEGVGLIVAEGAATLAVVRAKPAVPVVFAYSGDPVVAGIAQSFVRPGGDATGMSFMSLELNPKRIDLVHLALPEGTLDRFTGDGMMVFFNDPLPCPDAPERATRLAIEMRDAVAKLGETWRRRGHRLGFGIGMAQGYATLGRIGFEDRFDYTAIGAVINLAARLCAEAEDGQVLVSGRLAAAAEAVAVVEELGERQLRGMARPVGVACLRTIGA